MAIEIRCTDREDGLTLLALVGKLDMQGLHQVDMKFHGYTAARRKSTIVDLSELELITSLGLGMIISCAKSLERSGAKMVLLKPCGMVEEVLKTAAIDKLIPIANSLDEAVAKVLPAKADG